MAALAQTIAPRIAKTCTLSPKPTTLLDLGGSHAVYSMAFQDRYPCLQATVVDTSLGVQVGNSIVAGRGLEEQIFFIVGDIWQLPLHGIYDVILILSIIACE